MGGFAAALAISSALVRRVRTGEGAFLNVSMLEATLTAMGWVASDYLVGGSVPTPMGNENRTAAPSETFTTADGMELVKDPRFALREDRKANREILSEEIEGFMNSSPTPH